MSINPNSRSAQGYAAMMEGTLNWRAPGGSVAIALLVLGCGEVEEHSEADATPQPVVDAAVGTGLDGSPRDADASGGLDAAVGGCISEIAFTGRHRGEIGRDVFVATLEDGHASVRAVQHLDADIRDIEWSPDGSRLAFASERDEPWEIYVFDLETSEEQRLSEQAPSGLESRHPFWSPDGEELLFTRSEDNRTDLWLMADDGSNVQLLVSASEEGDLSGVAGTWSPDGSRVAYVEVIVDTSQGTLDSSGEMYAMSSDGSGVVYLTDGDDLLTSPSWSPDGGLLAFGDWARGGVNIAAADGSEVREVASNWTPASEFIEWAPSGTRLVYTCGPVSESRICAVNADGSGHVELRPGSEPRYSPDGEQIAYIHEHELGVMAADGSGSDRLASEVTAVEDLAWRPCPEE